MGENIFPVVKITRLPFLEETSIITKHCQQKNPIIQKRFPVVEITRLPQVDGPCSNTRIGEQKNVIQKKIPVVEITRLPQFGEASSSNHIGKQKNCTINGVDKQKYPVVELTRLPEYDDQCSSVHIKKQAVEIRESRYATHRHRLSTCYKSFKISSCEVDILETKTCGCNNKSYEYSNFFHQRLLSQSSQPRINSYRRLIDKKRRGQQSIAMKLHSYTVRKKIFLFENHFAQQKFIHLRQKPFKSLNPEPVSLVKKCTVKIERLRISSSMTNTTYNENLSSSVHCDIRSFDSCSLREITSNDIAGIESGVNSGRMLSDDELWAAITKLNSNNILVLHPAVCLKATLSDKEDICNILADVNGSKHIIAPISNARSDKLTGYNTEGTHWSLIIVDIDRKKYYHLDSLPDLNHSSALQFCKNVNVLLKLKPFKFITKKCKQQSDSYSCGWEVIKNARKQVRLLKNRVARTQIKKRKKVIGSYTLYVTCKPKVGRL